VNPVTDLAASDERQLKIYSTANSSARSEVDVQRKPEVQPETPTVEVLVKSNIVSPSPEVVKNN